VLRRQQSSLFILKSLAARGEAPKAVQDIKNLDKLDLFDVQNLSARQQKLLVGAPVTIPESVSGARDAKRIQLSQSRSGTDSAAKLLVNLLESNSSPEYRNTLVLSVGREVVEEAVRANCQPVSPSPETQFNKALWKDGVLPGLATASVILPRLNQNSATGFMLSALSSFGSPEVSTAETAQELLHLQQLPKLIDVGKLSAENRAKLEGALDLRNELANFVRMDLLHLVGTGRWKKMDAEARFDAASRTLSASRVAFHPGDAMHSFDHADFEVDEENPITSFIRDPGSDSYGIRFDDGHELTLTVENGDEDKEAKLMGDGLSKVPDALRGYIRSVRMREKPHEGDTETTLRVMDAGDGHINVYPTARKDATAESYAKTLIHEAAHLWNKSDDSTPYLGKDNKLWAMAVATDPLVPSGYSAEDVGEDLAETVALFFGSRGTPEYSAYREQFPARFAILEDAFGDQRFGG
jgi:hypothetical protein